MPYLGKRMRLIALYLGILPLLLSFRVEAQLPNLENIRFTEKFSQEFFQDIMPEASRDRGAKSQSQNQQKINQRSTHQDTLRQALIGLPQENENKAQSTNARPTPGDGQESLLYSEIRQWLESRYQSLGQGQAEHIQFLNNNFSLGGFNYSGFTWSRPFGGFSLVVNRQLSPDLFDENRWIVMDTFTVVIEASHFLGKLKEANVIDINQGQMAAFAGINFKRTYTTYHFAQSFLQGLMADYRPLFLPFLDYQVSSVLRLQPEKLLKREDHWTVAAGGIIESPTWNGFSAYGGVMSEISSKSQTSIQRMSQDAQEFFRLSQEHRIIKRAGVAAGLQLDFFKLIKFTLLSYDLEYQAEKSQEITMSFKRDDIKELQEDRELHSEVNKILKNKTPVLAKVGPYVIKLDHKESESSQSKAMLLLRGKLKKSNFEQINVIKDQQTKTFVRTYSENIKLVQNFWSRIFSSVLFRLLQFPSFISQDSLMSKKLQLEYESSGPQSLDPKVMAIEHEEQFSLQASLSYQAFRTHRWQDKKYKNEAESFMHRFTTLSSQLRSMVRNSQLRGPLMVNTHIRVNGSGLEYFNLLSKDEVESEFQYICQSNRTCLKNLKTHYQRYKASLSKKFELIHLKRMLETTLKHLHDLRTFQVLFGESVFVHGSFQAISAQGTPFSTSHNLGQFHGLGIIDTFQRTHGIRAPASIWEE
jgi:hypothetical protein